MEVKRLLIFHRIWNRTVSKKDALVQFNNLLDENEIGVSDALVQHGDLNGVTSCTENGSSSEAQKASVGDALQSIPDTESSFYCGKYFSNGECKEQCVGCAEDDYEERKYRRERPNE